MRKTIVQIVLIAVSIFTIVFSEGSAKAATFPCFSNLTDSAWANGQPLEVTSKLNSDLILYHFEISPTSAVDLGGVYPIFGGDSSWISGEIPKSKFKSFISLSYGNQRDVLASSLGINLTNPDRFFKLNLIDVRPGAAERNFSMLAKYKYSGKDCSDREVSSTRTMSIHTIPTLNLETSSDVQLQELLDKQGRYYNIGDLKNEIRNLTFIKAWMANTKKNPLPIIYPKSYTFPAASRVYSRQSALEEVEGFSRLLKFKNHEISYFDSSDGCLTNANGENYLHLLFSRPFLKTSKSVCQIYMHVFLTSENVNYDFSANSSFWGYDGSPSAQIIVKGYATTAKVLTKVNFSINTSGPYCFKSGSFKMMKYGQSCPAGYVDTQS